MILSFLHFIPDSILSFSCIKTTYKANTTKAVYGKHKYSDYKLFQIKVERWSYVILKHQNFKRSSIVSS